ncbi:unnamed protein product [Spirodela intermedia]|uniref:Uncharacterized protein n=1 Tax=Spirodela intermedia TaxID=51605 RepID=A0A7I8J4Z2_SPIIN|nr:unnamed protein product [Spirodela intermedia]CAA6665124.1 unnamed protein product [Spirodela intermedia]
MSNVRLTHHELLLMKNLNPLYYDTSLSIGSSFLVMCVLSNVRFVYH